MSVMTPHPDYTRYQETWRTLRDAFSGSGTVKTASMAVRDTRGARHAGTRYLPMPSGMTPTQYASYRDRARWFAATEHAVHGLTGAGFRREPQIEAPPAMTAALEDITQTGVPLRTFAEQIVREALLMGRTGILVDFPKPETLPSGQVVPPPPESRPYWVSWQAEDILNWRTRQRQGDTITSLVVLRECVPVPKGLFPSDDFFVIEEVTQYRVLRLNEQGWYEVSLWREVPQSLGPTAPTFLMVDQWVPVRQGQPLDFIPFVFLAPFSLEPAVEKSLLEGLVEINYLNYRHSADYEHGLHLMCLPTPYVCSNSEMPTEPLLYGSATAWWIADNQAKVGILTGTNSMQPHEVAMANDVKEMASLGARLLDTGPLVQETATAALARTQGADSPMQALLRTASQGLSQALQIHACWQGLTETWDDTSIHLTLNTDLVAIHMEPQMLTALTQALLQDAISYETYWYNLQQGEIARPMIPVEDEMELLAIQEAARPLALPSPGALRPATLATNGTTTAPRR